MFNVKVIGADDDANSAGAAKSLQAVAASARLYTVTAYNSTSGTLYLQAHDAASAPADGAAPKLVVPIFATTSGGFGFADGTIFRNGIYLCWSSTDVTKTIVTANSGIIDASFRRHIV